MTSFEADFYRQVCVFKYLGSLDFNQRSQVIIGHEFQSSRCIIIEEGKSRYVTERDLTLTMSWQKRHLNLVPAHFISGTDNSTFAATPLCSCKTPTRTEARQGLALGLTAVCELSDVFEPCCTYGIVGCN